ncbi:MAG: CotH kinase family protein [Chitinophagaceae bacterium]
MSKRFVSVLLRSVACIALLLLCAPAFSQSVLYVNEVMASNTSTLADETGAYEDWIELYNPGAAAVSLSGYHITDDPSKPLKFTLTGGVVPAHGYLVLWASSDPTRSVLHTSFSLSASGETVCLYAPDGVTFIDSLRFGAQKPDISYGRTIDGAASLSFFSTPTPGASNNTASGYQGYLSAPVFSVPAGFYAAPFQLTLSSDEPGVTIVYTIDGSLPDSQHLAGTGYRYKNQYPRDPGNAVGPFLTDTFRTAVYASPVQVNDASVQPNRLSLKSSTYDQSPVGHTPSVLINKGAIVRARAYKPGYMPSDVSTATYFINAAGSNKYQLPVISLGIQENYLYGYDTGLYTAGNDFDRWRAANPSAQVDKGAPANWQRGTEYPMSFELFEAGSSARKVFTNAGMRLHGGWSRANFLKTIRVYFKSEYGQSDINYKMFPALSYTDYKTLLLHSSGDDIDGTVMRDMTIQNTVRQLRFDIQDGQPAIVFINGEFWGIHGVRRRYDDDYFKQSYNIDKEDLDLLENDSEVGEGDNVHYNAMRDFIKNNDMSAASNYAEVQTRMDTENFIDYQAAEIFFANTDWPHNNVRYFRKRTAYNPLATKGNDGRWRWVMYDMDFALGLGTWADHNSLKDATTNGQDWAIMIFKRLLTNETFRKQFITRYADLLNTTFLASNVNESISAYRGMLEPHMTEHIQRWKHPADLAAWQWNLSAMSVFANLRPDYARQHLRDEFGLSAEKKITVDVTDTTQGYIQVNTIDITSAFNGVPANAYPWTGQYYPEVPVTLVAKSKDGYHFVRWEGDLSGTNDTLSITLSDSTSVRAVFEKNDDVEVVVDTTRLIHYWHFNNAASGTLTAVTADYSETGTAQITYPGTGAGYMDATGSGDGTLMNTRQNQAEGKALRPRNPANTRSMLISASSAGYKDLRLMYATQRTSNGAFYQRINVSGDNGLHWHIAADSIAISTDFELKNFDLSADTVLNNKDSILLRIEFFGDNANASSGNNRFDNITISGNHITDNSAFIHYWHFNTLPEGQVTNVVADSSLLAGAFIDYAGSGAGYMDGTDTTEGTSLNAKYTIPAGKGLRVRNPATGRSLLLHAPTTGFANIRLQYAAMRTSNGAAYQRIYYSADSGATWQLHKDSILVSTGFYRYSIDLSAAAGVPDNKDLIIRIDFTGSNAAGSSGNNRFDNITITGTPVSNLCAAKYTWTGAVSSDWNNMQNWCGTILPVRAANVVIPAGVPNMPVINTGNNSVHAINIEQGATLTLQGGRLQATEWTINGAIHYATEGDEEIVNAPHAAIKVSGSGNKILPASVAVSGILQLGGSAKIRTGNFTLQVPAGNITGYNDSSYIITGNNTGSANAGGLKLVNVTAGTPLFFPVGTVKYSYNPCTIQYTGAADYYLVRVDTAISNISNSTAGSNVQRLWYLEKGGAGTATATVSLQWSGNEESVSFIRAKATVLDYIDPEMPGVYETQPVLSSAQGVYSISGTGITASGYYGVATYSPVPSHILEFTGAFGVRETSLQWTAKERNNVKEYRLERSPDDKTYSVITTVPASLADTSSYVYTDNQPYNGKNYYRLYMITTDGQLQDSAFVMLSPAFTPHILDFNGTFGIHEAALQWTTKERNDVKEYRIERSADDKSYSIITTLPSLPVDTGSYTYTDNQPYNGRNYYRLYMVTTDGQLQDSAFIMLSPVVTPHIISLSGNADNRVANLQWTARELQEINEYRVTRSVDSLVYTTITTINAAASDTATYSFTDQQPAEGVNHYKIYMLSGSYTWDSAVVTVIIPPAVLPHIIEFTGSANEGAIDLQWAAKEKQEVKEYRIERSNGSNGYSVIAIVNAAAIDTVTYSKRDTDPYTGLNVYRLYMIAIDGHIIDSATVSITLPAVAVPRISEFTGRLNNKEINLQWIASAQQGVKQYRIEKSIDNNSYSLLQLVTAGAGDTIGYTQTDNQPFNGVNFYKLYMIAADGHVLDSAATMVVVKQAGSLTVYPNPVKDRLQVYYNTTESKTIQLGLYDLYGRLVQQKQWQVAAGVNTINFNTAGLQHGIYLLKADGIATYKIIRE